MNTNIFSVYMDNISTEVVEAQRKCVESLLPENTSFTQYHYKPQNGRGFSHPQAIMECLAGSKSDVVAILDIDCIPLSASSIPFLVEKANEGTLVGGVQRANHISNNAHLYVGPFLMAFSSKQYDLIGRPSFMETVRGDCGEELTYVWQERGLPVTFLWPSDIKLPMWTLSPGHMFGLGTTYQGLFYHSFGIRQPDTAEQFISRCKEVLDSIEPKKEELKQVEETKQEGPEKVVEIKPNISRRRRKLKPLTSEVDQNVITQ